MSKKIAVGADHAGFEVKEQIKIQLKELDYDVEDLGTNSIDSVDYPDFGQKVAEKVSKGEADLGILVCGSGIGISIAANKIKGIRAALACNVETARLARQHNDANILSVGARTTPAKEIPKIVEAWLNAEFEEGRHQYRINKITALEAGVSKNSSNSS